jgi:hypothetical protein
MLHQKYIIYRLWTYRNEGPGPCLSHLHCNIDNTWNILRFFVDYVWKEESTVKTSRKTLTDLYSLLLLSLTLKCIDQMTYSRLCSLKIVDGYGEGQIFWPLRVFFSVYCIRLYICYCGEDMKEFWSPFQLRISVEYLYYTFLFFVPYFKFLKNWFQKDIFICMDSCKIVHFFLWQNWDSVYVHIHSISIKRSTFYKLLSSLKSTRKIITEFSTQK